MGNRDLEIAPTDGVGNRDLEIAPTIGNRDLEVAPTDYKSTIQTGSFLLIMVRDTAT